MPEPHDFSIAFTVTDNALIIAAFLVFAGLCAFSWAIARIAYPLISVRNAKASEAKAAYGQEKSEQARSELQEHYDFLAQRYGEVLLQLRQHTEQEVTHD